MPPPFRNSLTLALVAALVLVASCTEATPTPSVKIAAGERPTPITKADSVVFAAIDSAGLWGLDTSTVTFAFREGQYGLDMHDGMYVYTRSFVDTSGSDILDVLTNDGFRRTTNGRATSLKPKQDSSAREALNSVIYFAFLPRWLADEAADRAYEGLDTLRGRAYHRVRVGFRQNGGGVDYGDQFLYWFDVDDLSLDFLAYSYATNDGGVRFREAFNTRIVSGITVQDYRNYAAEPEGTFTLDEMAKAWSKGKLELLSTVGLEGVKRG